MIDIATYGETTISIAWWILALLVLSMLLGIFAALVSER